MISYWYIRRKTDLRKKFQNKDEDNEHIFVSQLISLFDANHYLELIIFHSLNVLLISGVYLSSFLRIRNTNQ